MPSNFFNNTAFNTDIDFWDTSSVTDMQRMFSGAAQFNKDIGGLNTSSVADISEMFWVASSFNQNIGSWVTLMLLIC